MFFFGRIRYGFLCEPSSNLTKNSFANDISRNWTLRKYPFINYGLRYATASQVSISDKGKWPTIRSITSIRGFVISTTKNNASYPLFKSCSIGWTYDRRTRASGCSHANIPLLLETLANIYLYYSRRGSTGISFKGSCAVGTGTINFSLLGYCCHGKCRNINGASSETSHNNLLTGIIGELGFALGAYPIFSFACRHRINNLPHLSLRDRRDKK